MDRLAAETLVQVLEFVMPGQFRAHQHYRLLRDLSSVCKHWKGVIDGAPSLWAILPLDQHVINLYTILVRSGSVPLTIVEDRPTRSSPMSQYLLDTLLTHSTRFSALIIKPLTPKDVMLCDVLTKPLPLLHILHAELPFGFPAEWLRLLGQTQCPNLRKVRVIGQDIHLSSAITSGSFSLLTELFIDDRHGRYAPTSLQLEALLRANPDLENLHLQLGGASTAEESPASGSPPIVMSKLKELVLLVWSRDLSGILGRLYLPPCNKMVLFLQADEDVTTSDGGLTLSDDVPAIVSARLQELLLKEATSNIILTAGGRWPSGAYLSLQDGNSRHDSPWAKAVAVLVRESQPADMLSFITALMRLLPPSSIVIRDFGWVTPENAVSKMDALCLLPKLQRIRICIPDHLALWNLIMNPESGQPVLRASHADVNILCCGDLRVAKVLRRAFRIDTRVRGTPRLQTDCLTIRCMIDGDTDTGDVMDSEEKWKREIGLIMHTESVEIAFATSDGTSQLYGEL